jgi:hypothetical protein
MRKLLLLPLLWLLPVPAQAALRVWPSPTCATTLQACIDGSVSGDELVIETLATDQREPDRFSKSLDLHSIGYSATLGSGRSLTINALNDGVAIKVRNLRLSGRGGGHRSAAPTRAHAERRAARAADAAGGRYGQPGALRRCCRHAVDLQRHAGAEPRVRAGRSGIVHLGGGALRARLPARRHAGAEPARQPDHGLA